MEASFRRVPFTAERRLVADAGWLGARRPVMHGLAEADVTRVRSLIRAHEGRTGDRLSLSAYVARALGTVIAEDPTVQGYRSWRGDLVVFDDVDVLMMVEVDRGGVPFPQPHIARAVNRRSWAELSAEIRSIQATPTAHEGARRLSALARVPWPLRRAAQLAMLRTPSLMRKHAGTVGLTSIPVKGTGALWGIGLPIHSVAVVMGGISEQPAAVDGKVVVREVLRLTISFNHDIVDGAPAARFVTRLIEEIESRAVVGIRAPPDASTPGRMGSRTPPSPPRGPG
jgi:pyruvate/2-oxoglutarate dehydrogenase complex dihydrolipoamide acyltransferase (E2) component